MSSSSRSQMTTTMNGKRPSTLPPRHHQQMPQNDPPTSQHSDLIKYICDSWKSISKEYQDNYHNQHGNSSDHRHHSQVLYYQERESNPRLKDFEPFDLERLLNQRSGQNSSRNASS